MAQTAFTKDIKDTISFTFNFVSHQYMFSKSYQSGMED
jgi:hypothetical protein